MKKLPGAPPEVLLSLTGPQRGLSCKNAACLQVSRCRRPGLSLLLFGLHGEASHFILVFIFPHAKYSLLEPI